MLCLVKRCLILCVLNGQCSYVSLVSGLFSFSPLEQLFFFLCVLFCEVVIVEVRYFHVQKLHSWSHNCPCF